LIALNAPVLEARGLPGATLSIADEVSPAAKIGFALLLALFLIAARKVTGTSLTAAVAVSIVAASLAMALMLVALPVEWSRGFGIGLTGVRFAPVVTAFYFIGASLAGLAFALSETKCRRAAERNQPA
jgi:hypothetical protein